VINSIESSIFADKLAHSTEELHEDGRGECGCGMSTCSVELEPTLWEKLAELAEAEAITVLSITLTAFALLLQRLAGGPIALGVRAPRVALTARTKPAVLPLGLRVNAASDFLGVAANVSRLLEEAAIGSVVEDAQQKRYAYRFACEDGDAENAEEDARPTALGEKLSLTLHSARANNHAGIQLSYDPACFSEERSASLVEAYAGLLRSIVAAPHRASAEYPVAGKHDRAWVWPYQSPLGLCALQASQRNLSDTFVAIVSRWPTASAVAWPGGSMNFAEVSEAASRVVNALRQAGAEGDEVIAFRLPNGTQGVLFLATQIAGFQLNCAILPLGQQYEVSQAVKQLETMQAEFLIDADAAQGLAPAWASQARRFSIEGFPDAILLVRPTPPARHGRDTAFILATSGTTGAPKAIRLSHLMLLGLLRGVVASGHFPSLPTLMGANIAFDMAIADLWLAWVYGRHVVMLQTERRTPSALEMARDLGARVVSLSPTVASAALGQDPNCFAGFHTLYLVGEALPRALGNRLGRLAPQLKVINAYGPAETSILATLCPVAPQGESSPPIGRALAGYSVLIACPRIGAPLPRHWPGELLITGPAPSLGYADAEMTAARFVHVPGESQDRFFRTGDLGWVDREGQIRFIGRHDRQHKLAGVRIELDGVEHVISQLREVAEVAALVVGPKGALQVAAAVKPSAFVDDRPRLREKILDHCRAWLPRAAIPARLIFLDEMPTGGSGKKAHAALRAILERASHVAIGVGRLPEANSIEARLAQFWREQLAANQQPVDAIYLEDDVFALGATSLDAVAVLEHIEENFAISFSDDQIFLRRTIASQAEAVRAAVAITQAPCAPNLAQKRVKISLSRAAKAPGGSQGLVFAPPGHHGGAYFAGKLAANALEEFDIWSSSGDFGGKRMDVADVALEVVDTICEAIIRGEIALPRALVGFSISAWLAWLIERQMVASGFGSIPIVNFDGGPTHLLSDYKGPSHTMWREKVATVIERTRNGRRTEMLLLHRPQRGWYGSLYYPNIDWTSLDVDIFEVRLRSLRHMDACSDEVVLAMRSCMSSFIKGEREHFLPTNIAVSGPSGAAYDMLEAAVPPRSSDVRRVIGELPNGHVEPNLRAPLLFLAAASGDADLTLAFARRLAYEDPSLRFPVYAEVATLAAIDERANALERAAAWRRQNPNDERMRARAEMPFAPVSWRNGPESARFPAEGLDFAVGFIAQATRAIKTA
jgi:non-ribosomal peptide synthetase component F/acyl carrier protein